MLADMQYSWVYGRTFNLTPLQKSLVLKKLFQVVRQSRNYRGAVTLSLSRIHCLFTENLEKLKLRKVTNVIKMLRQLKTF